MSDGPGHRTKGNEACAAPFGKCRICNVHISWVGCNVFPQKMEALRCFLASWRCAAARATNGLSSSVDYQKICHTRSWLTGPAVQKLPFMGHILRIEPDLFDYCISCFGAIQFYNEVSYVRLLFTEHRAFDLLKTTVILIRFNAKGDFVLRNRSAACV